MGSREHRNRKVLRLLSGRRKISSGMSGSQRTPWTKREVSELAPGMLLWRSRRAPDFVKKNNRHETGRLPIPGTFASFASCPNSLGGSEVLSPRSVGPRDGRPGQSCGGRL